MTVPAAIAQFQELATAKGVPQEAIDAATCIVKLAKHVDDPTEYREHEIRGFDPHLAAMKATLVAAVKARTEESVRDFLRAGYNARSYAIGTFANDHGVLMLSYDAMLAMSRLGGLDFETEYKRFQEEEDRAKLAAPGMR